MYYLYTILLYYQRDHTTVVHNFIFEYLLFLKRILFIYEQYIFHTSDIYFTNSLTLYSCSELNQCLVCLLYSTIIFNYILPTRCFIETWQSESSMKYMTLFNYHKLFIYIHVYPYSIHIDIYRVFNFVLILMHLIRSIALHRCVHIIHLIAYHTRLERALLIYTLLYIMSKVLFNVSKLVLHDNYAISRKNIQTTNYFVKPFILGKYCRNRLINVELLYYFSTWDTARTPISHCIEHISRFSLYVLINICCSYTLHNLLLLFLLLLLSLSLSLALSMSLLLLLLFGRFVSPLTYCMLYLEALSMRMYVARVQHFRGVHIPLHTYRSIAFCNYECYSIQTSILNHACNHYSSAVDEIFIFLKGQVYCYVIYLYLYWYIFLIAVVLCKLIYTDNQSGYCCEGIIFYDLHQRVMHTYRKFG